MNDSESTCTAPGYRLHKLEVSNWGTFDSSTGTLHIVRPAGATTLLVGENGSGKSTLVDALLTLLVRPVVRNYNVAAGARKQERDERTYIKGAYGRVGRDDDNRGETQFLRPDGNRCSILLATFRNDCDDAFTLAQILYLNSEGGVEKIYCHALGEKSIAKDCSGIATTEHVRQQMEKRGFRATHKYVEYHGWLVKQTGIRGKAMDMFNQTVAVKDIQSLNRFIRDHMLEAQPWGEKIATLQAHFTDLTEAHASLVRVRKQSDVLKPIGDKGEAYQVQAAALARIEGMVGAAPSYFQQKTIDILTPHVAALNVKLRELEGERRQIDAELQAAQDDIRRIKNDLEKAGGERLRTIPLLIANHRLASQAKRERSARFHRALMIAGIPAVIRDEPALQAFQATIPKLLQETDAARTAIQRQRDAKALVRAETQQVLSEDRRELDSLGTRQTKLPESHVAVRAQLCQALRLSPAELPFCAELIAVRPEDRAWESSIEMVLRPLALSLLVPSAHYASVTRHIDQHRLTDERGRGQRLVYLRVAERMARPQGTIGSQSLLHKLRILDRHPLAPWIKAELEERFDCACCDTIEQFQAVRDFALTRERHVKMRGVRHEKDDRERAADPRYFVLGWDNKEKRQHLAREIDRRDRELRQLDGTISGLEQQLTGVTTRRTAIEEVQLTTSFESIDFASEERDIASLEKERRALEQASDVVRTLKEQLERAEAHVLDRTARRDDIVRAESDTSNGLRTSECAVENASAALALLETSGNRAKHAMWLAEIDGYFTSEPLNASTILLAENLFRDARRNEGDKLREDLKPIREDLCGLMSKYLRTFPEEAHDLNASIEYLNTFMQLHQRILEDDLPRHENRFKERLNEKVIQEIGLLNAAFQKERLEIESKIVVLNRSLKQLEYRPATFMRLELKPVRDPEIAWSNGPRWTWRWRVAPAISPMAVSQLDRLLGRSRC